MAKERYTEKQRYEKICQILKMASHLTALGYGSIRFVEEKVNKNDTQRV
jgi:hypothetical protein